MANKVDAKHSIYGTLESKRDVFRAVKGGTDAVQAKGKIYLPKFPDEPDSEYQSRLKASTIDGIVANGVDTLTGAVFYGDIQTDPVTGESAGVNAAIVPLLENIDNKGNSFNVFARNAFEAAFEGCSLIVIDRPNTTAQVKSAEDEKTLNIRTYWRLYYAGDVINWRYRVNPVSKATELELIVLSEKVDEVVDRFEIKAVQKYRVYFLNGNLVQWELWRKVEKPAKADEQFVLEDNGSLPMYSAIPISIIGCLDDEPRLLVESRLEIKAYQKESSFDVIEYLSIPIFYTIGYDGDDPIAFGASTHVKVPSGQGNAVGFAQIDSAGHLSLKGTIEGIKSYIRSRLADLTTAASAPDKTATQTLVEDRDKQARLIVWAEQFKDALELALGFTAESMGMKASEGGEIVLQTKWIVEKQQAEEAKAQKMAADQANVAATLAKAQGN